MMDGAIGEDVRIERQAFFTRMASAFARRDWEAVARGVVPEFECTLRGSSWLAGIYRGYEEFGRYVFCARLILEPTGRPITYLHHDDEMVLMHEYEVGSVGGPLIPLHSTVRFAPDGRLASLIVQPKDQRLFDEAVDSFLLTRDRFGETG